MPLPSTERILLGPGPSLIAPRVMRAMAAPVLSHLDPDFVPLLDDVRLSLRRLFKADEQSLTLATSGTGTSAMEAAVANVVSEGARAVVVVTGYFGDRLVQIMERYGARVRRIDGPDRGPAAFTRRASHGARCRLLACLMIRCPQWPPVARRRQTDQRSKKG